jgi:hypothetical protein
MPHYHHALRSCGRHGAENKASGLVDQLNKTGGREMNAAGVFGLFVIGILFGWASCYPGYMPKKLRWSLGVLAAIHLMPVLVAAWISAIVGKP